MKISIRVYITLIINFYSIVYGKLVFEACNKNGWKCGKLNNVDKYDIEYNCVFGNNSRAKLFLWSFNAPNNTYGLKITNCDYLELDLSCGTDNQLINNVTIYDINILNITSSLHPDVLIYPAKLILDQIKKINTLPNFKHIVSDTCNNTKLTSLIVKNIDKIETIESYSINLNGMDTFVFDNVSITYVKPYAINVTMNDHKEMVINDCYIEKIDVRGINFRANDFILNNTVVLDVEKNGLYGSSYSFYIQDCLIGIVNPNALNIAAKHIIFTQNTFGQLLPQAFNSISPDLSKDTLSKNKFIYNYIFNENKIYEANIGGLSPNWAMYQDVKLNFNFVKNSLPCSCEELGWLNLKSGIGNGLQNVIPFSKKILKFKTKNSCIDSPCSLPLSVISLMKFKNGICDPHYDLELICLTTKYKKPKKLKKKTSKKNVEEKENLLAEHSDGSRTSLNDVNYVYPTNSGKKTKRYIRHRRRYSPRIIHENDFNRRRIRRNKQSKKSPRRKQNKSKDSLILQAEEKPKIEKNKKGSSFPDLHLLDEIHLEDGTNHESFEDELEYNVIKNEHKKPPLKKTQPKTKRYAKSGMENFNNNKKPIKQPKIYIKSTQPKINQTDESTKEIKPPDSNENGDHLELDQSKIEVAEKFSTFEEVGDDKLKFPSRTLNPKLDNPFKTPPHQEIEHSPDYETLILKNNHKNRNSRTDDKNYDINIKEYNRNQRLDERQMINNYDRNRRIEDNYNPRLIQDNPSIRIENYKPHDNHNRMEDNYHRMLDNHNINNYNQRVDNNYNQQIDDNYHRIMEENQNRMDKSRILDPNYNRYLIKNNTKNNRNHEMGSNYGIGDNYRPEYNQGFNKQKAIVYNPNNEMNFPQNDIKYDPNQPIDPEYKQNPGDDRSKSNFKEEIPTTDFEGTRENPNGQVESHPDIENHEYYEHQDNENSDNASYFKNDNKDNNNQNFVRKLMDLKNLLEINNLNSNQKKNMLRTVIYKPFQNLTKPFHSKIKNNKYNIKMDSTKPDTIRFEINEADKRDPKKPLMRKQLNKKRYPLRKKPKQKIIQKKLPTKVIWLLNTNNYKWNKNQPIVLLPKIIAIPDSGENEDDFDEEESIINTVRRKQLKKSPKRNLTNPTQSKTNDFFIPDKTQLYRGEEINLEKYLSTIYGNNSKTLSSKYKYKKFLPVTDNQKPLYTPEN